jgi:hypothetical protein
MILRIRFGEDLRFLEHICQLKPCPLTKEKVGPWANVTDAESHHNPVLTLIVQQTIPQRMQGNPYLIDV